MIWKWNQKESKDQKAGGRTHLYEFLGVKTGLTLLITLHSVVGSFKYSCHLLTNLSFSLPHLAVDGVSRGQTGMPEQTHPSINSPARVWHAQ
jgi:hypothetical protein